MTISLAKHYYYPETPEDERKLVLRSRLFKINSDRAHPYWNFQHPSHDEAVREVRELGQKLYGGLRP